ncbi:12904_t:CDS:2, partial [Funneliformis caledonium]
MHKKLNTRVPYDRYDVIILQKISIKERHELKKTKNLKQRCRSGCLKVLSLKKQRHFGQLARSRADATSFEIADTLNNTYP